jgi:hypothetical protein
MDTKQDPNPIIDQLGGTSAVARLCEVTKASVSQWRSAGIPKARLMFLKLARPEVFEKLGAGEAATEPHQEAA